MKIISDLSLNELHSLIMNAPENKYLSLTDACDCASCGDSVGAKYYYICDACDPIEQIFEKPHTVLFEIKE